MQTDINFILNKFFNYTSFRGNQEQIINRLLTENGHSLVLMPTGGGKSLCYQVPALVFEGGTLVISPLISLMQDQVDTLRSKNIPASFINSTVNAHEKKERLNSFIEGKLKLLYVTPEGSEIMNLPIQSKMQISRCLLLMKLIAYLNGDTISAPTIHVFVNSGN